MAAGLRERCSASPRSTGRVGSALDEARTKILKGQLPLLDRLQSLCCGRRRDLGRYRDRPVVKVRGPRPPAIAFTAMAPGVFEDGSALGDSPAPRRHSRGERFTVSVVTGVGALTALAVGSALGNIHDHSLHEKLFALFGAIFFLILAVISIQTMAATLETIVTARAGRSGGSAVKVITSLTGYVIVVFVGLGLLAVPIQHLLLGGALTGVILGIAAQQALGNVFAGLVLLLARPFVIGERIKVRSGALGGILEGVVVSMTLAYVTIHTDEGPVNVPNLALLSAAVGPAPAKDAGALSTASISPPPGTAEAAVPTARPAPTGRRFGARALRRPPRPAAEH